MIIKKETIKEQLAKKIDEFSSDKFSHFSSLLTALKSIVDLDVNNLPSITQINIFADYAPRGQPKVHYTAIFNKNNKSVVYDGVTYQSANQAMGFIRESVGVTAGQRAGVFWKYLDDASNTKPLSDLL